MGNLLYTDRKSEANAVIIVPFKEIDGEIDEDQLIGKIIKVFTYILGDENKQIGESRLYTIFQTGNGKIATELADNVKEKNRILFEFMKREEGAQKLTEIVKKYKKCTYINVYYTGFFPVIFLAGSENQVLEVVRIFPNHEFMRRNASLNEMVGKEKKKDNE